MPKVIEWQHVRIIVGGTTKTWHHRNSHTCISYALTSHVAYNSSMQTVRDWTGEDSIYQIDMIFLLWNCGDSWSPVSYVYLEHLTDGINVHHDYHTGHSWIFYDHNQRYLARIICSKNGSNWIHIQCMHVQQASSVFFLTSMLYRSRRPTRVLLLPPWNWTLHFTWVCDITKWIWRTSVW